VVDISRMVHEPQCFRDIVQSDLRRAARLIVRVQDEIDPQFRLATPEGDFHLAVTLSPEPGLRSSMLRRISTLMAWKQVFAFTLSSELYEPDAVCSVGVSKQGAHLALMRITRSPKPWTQNIFWPIEWPDTSHIGDELVALLPKAPRAMTPKEVSMCQQWFGPEGKFPLVHIETNELRDV